MSGHVLPFTAILFDVDGTLVDSGSVVVDCFIQTSRELGLPEHPRDHYLQYAGPPLRVSFANLGLKGEQIDQAITHYRSLYHHRFLEPGAFPGIDELLHGLVAAQLPLATATSKQEYMAKDQLEHLGLAHYFTHIVGATPSPQCTKTTVIRDALQRLDADGVDISRPVLIGDRIWDVHGGAEVGLPVIGVEWGYADPGELDDAFARVVDTTEALDLLTRS